MVAVSVGGGGLSAWAASLLLIPMLFATRVCIAAWADSMLRDQQHCLVAPALAAPKALPPVGSAGQRDLSRWEDLRRDLLELQQTLAHSLELRPFRGLGAPQTASTAPKNEAVLVPRLSAT